ncbi:MAG: hypothetical protein J6T62_04175 [Fibrobacter sp.]|nr:hypothetical protein [Fibrobacter sp.]MBO7550706.1 hypothetical protein [Fibrobacter sp.]
MPSQRVVVDTQALESLIAKIKKGDAEIITTLEDETAVRQINDDLLQQQIEEVAVQTDWEQGDETKLDYLKNKPIPITQADIDAIFI